MAHNKHPADARFINSRLWRDHIRAKQLRDHPLCEECKAEGKTTVATSVDHVIVPNGDPTLQRSPSNFRSLCDSHHSRKTNAQARGYTHDLDADGYPISPLHPANRPSKLRR